MDCIHQNGDITGFSVQYGSETVSVSGDSSGGMYVISGLMPSTTYSTQVAAMNSAGTGPHSAVMNQLTEGIYYYSHICTHVVTISPFSCTTKCNSRVFNCNSHHYTSEVD